MCQASRLEQGQPRKYTCQHDFRIEVDQRQPISERQDPVSKGRSLQHVDNIYGMSWHQNGTMKTLLSYCLLPCGSSPVELQGLR